MKPYYSYAPMGAGFELHETEEQARFRAESLTVIYLDKEAELDEADKEDLAMASWGRVLGGLRRAMVPLPNSPIRKS